MLADVFDKDDIEIYKRSKDFHLKQISKNTGVPLEVDLYCIFRKC